MVLFVFSSFLTLNKFVTESMMNHSKPSNNGEYGEKKKKKKKKKDKYKTHQPKIQCD
jgi:hypothetical protein